MNDSGIKTCACGCSRRKLPVYLVLVFGISWVSWGPLVALAARKTLTYGQPGYMILLVVGGVAPAIAAYLSTLLTERRDGVRAYNRLVFKWRLGALWYAMPLIVLLGTVFVAGGLTWLFGRGVLSLKQPWYTFFPTFAIQSRRQEQPSSPHQHGMASPQ